MVGHTGVFEAAVKACETVDACVGKIAQKAKENNVIMLFNCRSRKFRVHGGP